MVMQDDCPLWRPSEMEVIAEIGKRMKTDMTYMPGHDGCCLRVPKIRTGAHDDPGLTLRVFLLTGNPFTGPEQYTVQQAR